jgi:Fe2+ transport system protein FeoA
VLAVRRAPLGDPTVYEFRGTRLCLRHSEARRVQVRVERRAAREAAP